jgi:hypothetical protein
MQNGYYVAGAGKIYHDSFRRDSDWNEYLRNTHGDPKPKGKDLGVGGISRKSGNEIHQLILATERLRASLMLAIKRSRRPPPG